MRAASPVKHHPWIRVVTIAWISLVATGVTSADNSNQVTCSNFRQDDRLWLISTRGITSAACHVDLQNPSLNICRLNTNGEATPVTLDEYVATVNESRSVVVYVHGNRMKPHQATIRGMMIYKNCTVCRNSGPIDWVIWSWPSEQTGVLAYDVREKADRTDAQGLYLAWLLRQHLSPSTSTTLIGYSFGGRIVTGALHALAGGSLGERTLGGPTITGISFGAGLIAPAIDSHWLTQRGYHSRATQNLSQMVLLYNRRDIVLKRYWLVDKVRGRMALGYSGPTQFGPRADGSRLPVSARDCSPSIGPAHDELDYYAKACRAGSEMGALIDDMQRSR